MERRKGSHKCAVNGVNLLLTPGVWGLLGANGAGKTTLFKVLTGEISADGGEFYLKKDASLGYLAQNIQIDSDRTIYEEMLSVFEKTARVRLHWIC